MKNSMFKGLKDISVKSICGAICVIALCVALFIPSVITAADYRVDTSEVINKSEAAKLIFEKQTSQTILFYLFVLACLALGLVSLEKMISNSKFGNSKAGLDLEIDKTENGPKNDIFIKPSLKEEPLG